MPSMRRRKRGLALCRILRLNGCQAILNRLRAVGKMLRHMHIRGYPTLLDGHSRAGE